MMMDGEWRIAFIRDQAPDLQYGTAPFPTFDPSRYGAGYTVTNVLGINKGSKNVEAAWALVKYMSTDTDNLITLANGVSNIPPTTAALKGTYTLPSQFQTFLDIATNSNTSTPPNTTIGHGPQDAIANAWNDFQAKGGDPATILGAVDKSVNDSLGLSGQ